MGEGSPLFKSQIYKVESLPAASKNLSSGEKLKWVIPYQGKMEIKRTKLIENGDQRVDPFQRIMDNET